MMDYMDRDSRSGGMNMDSRARGKKKTVGTKGGTPFVAGKKPVLPKRRYGISVSSEQSKLTRKK